MSSPEPPARPVFRADVQGLRAVAVVAVILNHVIGWPAGGFAGVDVFFVISGFLITGLLLRDREEHGRVSLRTFYAKRMRRILPAAVTVLVATSVAAYFLFNRPRAVSTWWDAVSSLFFVSNWRFAAEGTDYFHASDAVSPLQHFWSLSVEEQFYLVWPWLMLLVLAVAARSVRASGTQVRIAVGVALTVIVAASFGYALGETATSPAPAYFSTLSRVWELGVGALLAAAAPALARLPLALRVLGGWLGLAGILASFFVLSADTPFPGPWAAFPVLATALVVAAGVGGRQRHLVPLVNPVSVFFGDLSYSLYLWHFPILVFLLVLMPEQTTTVTLIILGLTLAVSLVSYFLIEQPLHRSPWLAGRGSGDRAERRAAWQSWRERFGAQFILSSLGLVVIVVAVAVSAQVTLRGGPSAAPPPGAPVAVAPDDGSGSGDAAQPTTNPEDELQAQLASAAAATSWPGDLSPSLDDAIATGSGSNPARACFDIGATPDFGACTWGSGDAPNHLYLVGDSEALSYAPAFKALAESSDGRWKITTVGLYGCRFTDVLIQNDGAGVMDACQQRKQDVASRVAADAPQLVVVANAYALGKASDGRPLSTADIVASTVAETAKYGASGRMVYLAPPPLGASLGQCYSPATSPQNCNVGIDQAWQDFQSAISASAAASGDHVVSSLPFSCANGVCPAFAGTLPTKYDTVHLTPQFAATLAPSLRWELAAQGLF